MHRIKAILTTRSAQETHRRALVGEITALQAMQCLQELSFLDNENLTFPNTGITGNRNRIAGYTEKEIEIMSKYFNPRKKNVVLAAEDATGLADELRLQSRSIVMEMIDVDGAYVPSYKAIITPTGDDIETGFTKYNSEVDEIFVILNALKTMDVKNYDSQDLNANRNVGNYHGANMTNGPKGATSTGFVTVLDVGTAGICAQYYYDDASTEFWVRGYHAGGWSVWKKADGEAAVATHNADLRAHPGGVDKAREADHAANATHADRATNADRATLADRATAVTQPYNGHFGVMPGPTNWIAINYNGQSHNYNPAYGFAALFATDDSYGSGAIGGLALGDKSALMTGWMTSGEGNIHPGKWLALDSPGGKIFANGVEIGVGPPPPQKCVTSLRGLQSDVNMVSSNGSITINNQGQTIDFTAKSIVAVVDDAAIFQMIGKDSWDIYPPAGYIINGASAAYCGFAVKESEWGLCDGSSTASKAHFSSVGGKWSHAFVGFCLVMHKSTTTESEDIKPLVNGTFLAFIKGTKRVVVGATNYAFECYVNDQECELVEVSSLNDYPAKLWQYLSIKEDKVVFEPTEAEAKEIIINALKELYEPVLEDYKDDVVAALSDDIPDNEKEIQKEYMKVLNEYTERIKNLDTMAHEQLLKYEYPVFERVFCKWCGAKLVDKKCPKGHPQ